MTYPTYPLTLHKTYYEKGFFNLGVSVDKYIRPTSGPIRIILGSSNRVLNGSVSREANLNGAPRIFGRVELRDWMSKNYSLKDKVTIEIISPNEVRIK